jgi:hypothetical protein
MQTGDLNGPRPFVDKGELPRQDIAAVNLACVDGGLGEMDIGMRGFRAGDYQKEREISVKDVQAAHGMVLVNDLGDGIPCFDWVGKTGFRGAPALGQNVKVRIVLCHGVEAELLCKFLCKVATPPLQRDLHGYETPTLSHLGLARMDNSLVADAETAQTSVICNH